MERTVLFVKPEDPDHPFSPKWEIPDKDRFNDGQAYFEILERDNLRLVNHDPLAKKINYLLEDDTLDLENVRGFEGMIFILSFFM